MKVPLKAKQIFVGIIVTWFSEAFVWKQGPILSRLFVLGALKRIIIRFKSGDESDSENKINFCFVENHCNVIFRGICLNSLYIIYSNDILIM